MKVMGIIYMTTFSYGERSGRVFFDASRPSSLASAYRPALRPRLRPNVPAAVPISVSSTEPIPASLPFSDRLRSEFFRSRDHLLVGNVLPGDGIDEAIQTLKGVALDVPFVQPEGKFVNVAAKVLNRDVMEGSVQAALENGPNALYPVRARHPANVLTRRMVDALLPEEQTAKAVVGRMLIRNQHGADFHIGVDSVLNRFHARTLDGHGLGSPTTFAHPEYGSLAHGAASHFQLVGFVLISLQAADESLVNLHDTAQLIGVLAARLTEPLQHEPSRLLGNTNLFGELERTDSLAGGDYQIHRVNPLVQRDVRTLEDRSCANGEVQLTRIATVVAVLALCDALVAFALWALHTTSPQSAFKIHACRCLIGERGEQLKCADSRAAHYCFPLQSGHGIACNGCFLCLVARIILPSPLHVWHGANARSREFPIRRFRSLIITCMGTSHMRMVASSFQSRVSRLATPVSSI